MALKQILQKLSTSVTVLTDVTAPRLVLRHFLIRTTRSVISAGTVRMLGEFGKANRSRQPKGGHLVLDEDTVDSLVTAAEVVRSRLDKPPRPRCFNIGRLPESGAG